MCGILDVVLVVAEEMVVVPQHKGSDLLPISWTWLAPNYRVHRHVSHASLLSAREALSRAPGCHALTTHHDFDDLEIAFSRSSLLYSHRHAKICADYS